MGIFNPFAPGGGGYKQIDEADFRNLEYMLDKTVGIPTKVYDCIETDEEGVFDVDIPSDFIPWVNQQKLWCLLSFIIWNKFLLKQNLENEENKKLATRKRKTAKQKQIEKENNKLSELLEKKTKLGKNQVSFVLYYLYKDEGLLVKLNKIDLNVALSWRNLFHESLLERIGNVLVERFGYGYSKTNM